MAELNQYRHFMKKEELHKSLNSLVGILAGIIADGKVKESEQNEVTNWYVLHEPLINLHPYNEILPYLHQALVDDVLDMDEAENVFWLCKKLLDKDSEALYFDMITSKIQRLEGALHGLIADGVIADEELEKLNDWLNDNEDLSGVYPFDEVYSLLLAAKEDGVVTEDERNMLKAFFSTFVDTRESYNINEKDVKDLQEKYSIGGICAVCPEIQLQDKLFCFTGASKRGTRDEIAAQIEAHGGKFNPNVTKKTDYLIVGADGNPCWAYSCYGRKVEKAEELRKTGGKILIVHEYDFWDEIG